MAAILTNLNLVRQAVTKVSSNVDLAARAARDEIMNTLTQLAHEEIRTDNGAPKPDGPPVNRTGNLRRSIRGERFNIGFANYSAIVGPTIEYGRVLELGFSNGNKYPYIAPSYSKFQKGAVLQQIFAKHLGGI
jgi:hypothetical protein